jgi:hypothetical protein
MLNLTAPWLDAARRPSTLPLVPGWRDMEPVFRTVADELTLMPADGSAAAALGAELVVLDRGHDRHGRVTDRILSGHVELADDADTSAAYARLGELVLPGGIGANTQISWSEESGRALVRARVLTPEVRTQLRAIPVVGGNLEQVVDRMQTAAAQIGEALARRGADGAPIITPEAMRATRLRWARLVRHMLEAIALAPALTPLNKAALTRPFDEAAQVARLRARAAGEDDEDPVVVPTPAAT